MKILKKQRGAALVLEASIIMPIVIMMVVFLVFASTYIIQKNGAQARAQRAVNLLGKLQARDKVSDAYIEGNKWRSDVEESKYIESYKKPSPYVKFLKFTFNKTNTFSTVQPVLKNDMENLLIKTVGEAELSFLPQSGLIRKTVGIKVTYKFPMLKALGYLGINGFKDGIVDSIAVNSPVMDNSEFVRNIDIAYDVGDFLAEKFGIKKKVSEITDKINGFLEKIKLK